MTNSMLWFIVGGTLLLLMGMSALSLLLSDDGLAMMRIRFLRYYRVGDLVTFGPNLQGRVTAINLFTTTLLTAEQDRVIISNRAVLNGAMIMHAHHPLATPLPTNLAPVMVSAAAHSPSGQPLDLPNLAGPVIDSPGVERSADSTARILTTTPLPANAVGDKALPSAAPHPDPVPSELQPVAEPAALPAAGGSRGRHAALPPGLQPHPWVSRQPLGKRPRLGTKSVSALSFGLIPALRRDQVVVNLPLEQPQVTNEQGKTSSRWSWRFGPTA